MASEIRVDKINSLSGVGTVTLSPTGVDIAGITTAATLRATTGIVTSLTAGSLTSLGAVSGTTGTFSGAVSGTTGTFSGAVSGTTGTFTGDLTIPDKIVHTGDTDTAIRLGVDTVTVETAGSERVRIDSSGRFMLNLSSSITGGKFQVNNQYNTFFAATNDANACVVQLEKTRSTSPGSYTIVQDGDKLGELQFKGSNGSASVIGANIQAIVNGTPGSGNDLPTDLAFRTMPDGVGSTVERLRITSTGDMGLGTGTPESKFAIKGTSGQQDLFSISDTTVPTSGGEYGVAMIKTNTSNRALNITNYNTAGIGVRIYTNGGASGRDCLQCYQAGGTRFIVNEDVTVSTGNLVIGTSGKGIDFSATGNGYGTMSNELLDDYEEGSWTPVFQAYQSGSWTSVTFDDALDYTQGKYTKIGNTVHFWYYTGAFSTTGTWNTLAARISGLPYVAQNTSPFYGHQIIFTHTTCFKDTSNNLTPIYTGYAGGGGDYFYPNLGLNTTNARWGSESGRYLMVAGTYQTG